MSELPPEIFYKLSGEWHRFAPCPQGHIVVDPDERFALEGAADLLRATGFASMAGMVLEIARKDGKQATLPAPLGEVEVR